MPVLYKLNKDKRKTSRTVGQYFARAIHVGVIDTDGLAKIMQANCTIKASDIKAVLTELVETMATQLQNSMRVKLDGLGSFKIGIRGIGSNTIDDYSVTKNVKGLRINFQPETKKDSTGVRQKAMLSGTKVQEAPRNENIGEKEAAKAKGAPSAGGGTK
ncbi:HU family DNA-binding protein [Xylanibacter oryzae]|uniref:HU family DNA-binding protein n=1 Tax=Xylanibacter oryzae TaxID=185293 RepID=UPI0004AF5B41|nr:HU family DNA-binding protein [Xylanibacter oryzae]